MELLNNEIINKIRKEIDAVISNESREFKIDFCSPIIITDYIFQKYSQYQDNFESNGADWDFWIDYSINGKHYVLSGSGYYGYMTFKQVD